MIILDGKALAAKIISGLKAEIGEKKFSLAAILIGDDPVIGKFVAQKKKTADELGVDFRIYRHGQDISTNELRKRIAVIAHEADPDGIIIQLPLPPHISGQYVLNGVPPKKDVDVLSARAIGDFAVGRSKIFPPVVGAVKTVFDEYRIDHRSGRVVLVGAGELVGRPLSLWLLNEKATFSVVGSTTPDIGEFTKKADILISGVGKPGLVTGDMIKDGAVVIDCGTSESGGALKGDVDFDSVGPKTSFITPVPGGVGPITVAMIFKNLLLLAKKK